ncbi:MAG: hypothetical protein WC498_04400 [Candidatus Saccharimonadales bacterium]
MIQKPYLCKACPGKDNGSVDFDVTGSCPITTADSFKQARRNKLESPKDYSSDDELAELITGGLYYYDDEDDDGYFEPGDEGAARLGIDCAKNFLEGKCSKTIGELILESET